MKIISVAFGLPRNAEWKGKTVTTGIYKEPLRGSVNVRTLNLGGMFGENLSTPEFPGNHRAIFSLSRRCSPQCGD